MAENQLYLTELIGVDVHDVRGRHIGRLRDAALVPAIDPARVDRFLVGGGPAWWTVRWEQVAKIELDDGIYLRDEKLTPYHDEDSMLRMVRDLLDQQIIDVTGRKVVRVNDLTFDLHHTEDSAILRLVEVAIGVQSIFRRLCQGILPPRWIRRLQQPVPPHSISWEVCNVIEPDPQRRLRLNISHKALEQMHPADLADIVEELGPEDRGAIFESLNSEVAAEALSEVDDPRTQAHILESLETDTAVMIMEEMSPHEAADLLNELDREASEKILEEMDASPKTELEELLEFEESSAGGMMNTEFVAVRETATVADARDAIRANDRLIDGLTTIFLTDGDDRPTGMLPVARLLLAEPQAVLRDLADEECIFVQLEDKGKRVTEVVDKYNLMALAVVDGMGRLVGAITADDVISFLRRG